MLIWLFTALLFARHGYYHPYGPPGSFSQWANHGGLPPGGFGAPAAP